MADEKINLKGRPQDWAGGPPEPEPPEDLLPARGEVPEGNPEPTAPPGKGYKFFLSLWEQQFEAVDEEGKPAGRQFKRLELWAVKHECTAGAFFWWSRYCVEQGVPWWRVASYEIGPRTEVTWKPWPTEGPMVDSGPVGPVEP